MTTAREDDAVPSVDRMFGLVVNTTATKRGVSKKKLAAALGITPGALSKKLWGHRPWVLAEQISAADALGVDLRDMLTEMWDEPTSVAHPQRRADDGWALRGSNPQPTDYKVEGSVVDLDSWRYNKVSKAS